MSTRRLTYFIIAAFLLGDLLLIFIKYTSDKNVASLIAGNKKQLQELAVNNELKTLESNVWLIESKIRGAVTTDDKAYVEGLKLQIQKVETSLLLLQKIRGGDATASLIGRLENLVRAKLQAADEILTAYRSGGKQQAEAVIVSQRGNELTDSILELSDQISAIRQAGLSKVSTSVDDSVERMERLDTFLVVFVLVSAALLFWYIINIIRVQNRLLQQVKDSEQKVKEAAQVKENFLANMSHEIRTPMNAILGFTALLQQKKMDDESLLYVQTIQRSGESLLTIVNDILDFSKMEAGMMHIESAPFSLRGLLHSIQTLFAAKAAEKNIAVEVDVDESIPDTLEGDPTRLTQILVNLIGNAVKFTQQGRISITAADGGRTANGLRLDLAISDTGIGIDPDKLAGIFDRFQQADDAVTRRFGGTGLGLSIVKQLVLLQKGSIDVKSKQGEGATFYITLPYTIASEQMVPVNGISSSYQPQARLQNLNVLVVEDNEVNQTLLLHLFRNRGLIISIAQNGAEALQKLKEEAIDLILMDIQMPVMDGYTAAQQIRETLRLDTPIIAMTAHAMAGEREKCLGCGMNEYLSKPVREEQLWKLIAPLVSSKAGPQKETVVKSGAPSYQHIDLSYLKEVSNGNTSYEKTVTAQFIAAVPKALRILHESAASNDPATLRQVSHNLKTTVSVMGLNEKLQADLDALEAEGLATDKALLHVQNISCICEAALPEAEAYLASLP